MTSAPTVVFSGLSEDQKLERVMELWRKKYPQEVQNYLMELQYLRETTKKTTGAVAGGWGHLKASLPTRPFILMERLIPGFWENGGREKFLRRFSAFRITPPK